MAIIIDAGPWPVLVPAAPNETLPEIQILNCLTGVTPVEFLHLYARERSCGSHNATAESGLANPRWLEHS